MGRRIRVSAILVAMLAFVSVPLSAQKNMLGVHLGASIATLGGSDAGSPNSRTGLNVGASFGVSMSDVLTIQFGGAYAQKGAKESDQGVDVTLAMDYVEFPVLFRFGIPHSGPVGAHFDVGPAVAFNVSCKAKGSSQGVSASVDCDQFGSPIKNFDVGAMGGLGLDFAASPGLNLSLDVRYNLGMTKIAKDGSNVTNRALTIQAGAGFPLG